MSISRSTIRRRYDQGLDSIARLITQLEDRIENLSAERTTNQQRTIRAQAAEIN